MICKFLICGILFFTLNHSALANQAAWFEDCKPLAKKSKILADYFEVGIYPDLCFLMNKSEVIDTDNNAGTNFQGLYYMDLITPKFEPQRLGWAGTTDVVKEFVGINKKRYVLLSSGWANKGLSHGTYAIFNLIPRKENISYQYRILAAEWDNGGCYDPKEYPPESSCGTPDESLLLGDPEHGGFRFERKELNGRLILSKPRLLSSNGYVDAIEFDLSDASIKKVFAIARFVLNEKTNDFQIEDESKIVNALKRQFSQAKFIKK